MPSSKQKADNIFIDAQTLAEFANLEPLRVEWFRKVHCPEFVPEPWWSLKFQRSYDQELTEFLAIKGASSAMPKRAASDSLEESRQKAFSPEAMARATSEFQEFQDFLAERLKEKPEAPVYLWQFLQAELRQAWQEGKEKFPVKFCIKMLAVGTAYITIPNVVQGLNVMDGHVFEVEMENFLNIWDTTYPYQLAVMYLGTNPWRAAVCTCGKRFVKDKPSRRFCSDKCSQESRRLSGLAWWSEHGEQWRAKNSKKRKAKEK